MCDATIVTGIQGCINCIISVNPSVGAISSAKNLIHSAYLSPPLFFSSLSSTFLLAQQSLSSEFGIACSTVTRLPSLTIPTSNTPNTSGGSTLNATNTVSATYTASTTNAASTIKATSTTDTASTTSSDCFDE